MTAGASGTCGCEVWVVAIHGLVKEKHMDTRAPEPAVPKVVVEPGVGIAGGLPDSPRGVVPSLGVVALQDVPRLGTGLGHERVFLDAEDKVALGAQLRKMLGRHFLHDSNAELGVQHVEPPLVCSELLLLLFVVRVRVRVPVPVPVARTRVPPAVLPGVRPAARLRMLVGCRVRVGTRPAVIAVGTAARTSSASASVDVSVTPVAALPSPPLATPPLAAPPAAPPVAVVVAVVVVVVVVVVLSTAALGPRLVRRRRVAQRERVHLCQHVLAPLRLRVQFGRQGRRRARRVARPPLGAPLGAADADVLVRLQRRRRRGRARVAAHHEEVCVAGGLLVRAHPVLHVALVARHLGRGRGGGVWWRRRTNEVQIL
eukprot:Rhum_TRINITY_DN15307_c11_g2::Rhum_TRINITY_DN15307_c11_g2_i1::g.151967::m.151967